jgi:hypothetical protein
VTVVERAKRNPAAFEQRVRVAQAAGRRVTFGDGRVELAGLGRRAHLVGQRGHFLKPIIFRRASSQQPQSVVLQPSTCSSRHEPRAGVTVQGVDVQ